MSKKTEIAWAHSTYNRWIGCTKVSPGCANCYAADQDARRFSRTLPGCSPAAPVSHWGKGAPRHLTKTTAPLQWERDWTAFQQVTLRDGTIHCGDTKEITALNLNPGHIVDRRTVRRRVFSASLSDWLDDEVPAQWLADLLSLIFATPHLDWLLLTKRPENWRPRVDAAYHWIGERHAELLKHKPHRLTEPELGVMAALSNWLGGHEPPANVWIGTTVENQEYAGRRIPQLLAIPARVRFLSVEPMLGPVVLPSLCHPCNPGDPSSCTDPARCALCGIHWVICGGESGDNRRPFEIEWAQSLADQCAAAAVPFFMKQDAHRHSGQQGRIPTVLWARKEFPAMKGGATV